MQGPNTEPIQKPRVSRRLDTGAVYLHHNHISGGFTTAKRCPMCAEGLAGAITETKEAPAGNSKDGVAKGDGANEAGNPAPPSGNGASPKDDGDSVLEW